MKTKAKPQLTAKQAKYISRRDGFNYLLERIKCRAEEGGTFLGYIDLTSSFEKRLIQLGYKVQKDLNYGKKISPKPPPPKPAPQNVWINESEQRPYRIVNGKKVYVN